MNNVSNIIKNDLCTGCGTCIGLCSKGAIELRIDQDKGIYVPDIDLKKCNNCGLCYKICPGQSVDFDKLNLEIFKKVPEEQFIGIYNNFYVGHSKDNSIRKNSSSGGVLTQFLIYALETGLIDGVLVTRMSKDNPLQAEPFIARTKEEIISAATSKYCPVPVNVLLNEILDSSVNHKFAVVGLPCHIQGIRKAEKLNRTLRDKIVIRLGIFCNHTPTQLGTDFILKEILHVNKENIKEISYRGNGWPGYLSIELEDGTKKYLYQPYIWGNIFTQFFYPFRCTLCCDQTNELAEISFGDAWLPELTLNASDGHSLIITRTKFADDILKEMRDKQKIELSCITLDKVRQSQSNFHFRKNLKARIKFCSLFKKQLPEYNKKLGDSNKLYYLKCVWFYFNVYISSKRKLWTILPYYISIRSFIGKVITKIKEKS